MFFDGVMARLAARPAIMTLPAFRHASRVTLSSLRPALALQSSRSPFTRSARYSSIRTTHHCSHTHKSEEAQQPSPSEPGFWGSRPLWKRAGVNTFRCLVGCTLGDFSAMWFLQATSSDLGMGMIMGISMLSGLSTSMLLETTLLRFGADKLHWVAAAKTAAGMSFVSMLGMETVQNLVDYHLTSGVVALDDPTFWAAAVASAMAGFLAPLPYNYSRLKKYGTSCH